MGKRERTRPLRSEVRDGVLAAARAVFTEEGYHRASLDAIAARAGYSKGAVYSNFASKDDLFLALLEPEAVAMAAALTGLGDPGGTPDARPDPDRDLHRVAVGMQALSGIASPANLLFAEFRAHAARDPELAARVAEVRRRTVATLAVRLEDEVVRLGFRLRVPASEAVGVVLALLNGLSLEHVGRDSPVLAVATVESVLRGLVEPA